MTLAGTSPRMRAIKRHNTLVTERSSYDTHWRSIADNLLPRSSRFTANDRQKSRGDRNGNIIDSTATRALRVLAAGMMSGMTSPARPWFRLTVPDSDLAKSENARRWLFEVQNRMLRIFAKSNTYNALHGVYRELGAFGTAASVMMPSADTVIHQHQQTIGEYTFALNHLGAVNTFSREFAITVEQLVDWFGTDNISNMVRNMYDRGDYDTPVTIVHLIEPRRDRDPGKRDNRNMPFKDLYLEKAGDGDAGGKGFLQESGHQSFPLLSPRWDVLWNDAYGAGPGMDALGDCMQLQHQQMRKAKAIDYQSDPPLQLPTAMRGQENDLLPGGVSFYDSMGPATGIRTAFEVQLDLGLVLNDIGDVRERINSAFYADMFLMLASSDDSSKTATEVVELHEEKLLMLGPVLERLHSELLSPLVEMTFERMMATGLVPPPPEELSGSALDIEYVSMLAQAQKAVGVNATDRLLGHIGVLANIKPEVVDRYDADKSVERYADQLGVDPDLIISGEQVALIRSQRAQAQAAQQQAAMAAEAAKGIGQLGSVQTPGGSNAGADLIGQFSGYGSPTPVEAALS